MSFGLQHWLSLAGVSLAVAVGQILFKATSLSLGQKENLFVTLSRNPTFWIAIMLYAGATLVWIILIRGIPISRAYMFMALTYIYVPILSAVFLKEQIGVAHLIGAFLIMAGIAVAASSES